ncbi:DUF4349 domain-containing protein [Ulvibacter litoralis]|uniref:DUF4349 domain-containing protein n=1 Tax=Ulvibacter litoralis TaxID=227084 RepID=A0A1G7DCP7_9FLAO|nr:DUF4349 domain-containing protein [Ulvibacter litoralis]GHC44216.1 hypothetical protein GCM10008083_03400 [Ulvibacter litoralis]SDE48726.1 protein of unknown function [Ulvibacter litoralis]
MKFSIIFLFGFALACSNGSSNKAYSPDVMEDAGYVMSEEIQVADISEDVEVQEQKIIKTARLVFETKDVNATHANVLQLASQYKGFIQSDNSGKGYNRISRNMMVRVPTERFMDFINGVSEGVSYFDQKDISRQDVSEEFVDLEARLKAKRELEKRYLELLKQARNVKEMLEIERELSNIREEIEAKQGRLQFLQNRVSMSTITLEFYTLTAETGVTQSYGQKMINSLKGGWDGISVFFLGILYLWPLLVIVLVGVIILRKLLRKKKTTSGS